MNGLKQRLSNKPAIKINEAHMARTAALAKGEFTRSKAGARIGFLAFCFRQVGFFGWQTWLMQAILLLGLSLALRLSCMTTQNAFTASIPFVLRTSAVLIALTALPTLYRSSKYRMLEVEISAWAGYVRLLFSRFILIGVGDALMLSSMLAFAVIYTNIGLANALFCLLLPFFTMLATFLFLLPRVPLRVLPYALFALGTAMFIVLAALGSKLPDAQLYPIWSVIALALIVLCAVQLYALKRQCGFADVQFS